MKFLLDTDTCVFWLRGYVSVRDHLAAVSPEVIAISVITLAELRYGAACSARPASNHQAVDDFISALFVLGVHPETAHAFGEIKAHLRKKGMLIDDLDLLIAAAARTHDLTLVTNNQDHFGRIPGLRLDNWMQP
ncbi:MAG: type II toxin-antitoxin system VapC family toxin [Chloroflexi bacterium]|nr:type II toxin-antitoxin system VapC family toxin [Chloroflexota bacterium]